MITAELELEMTEIKTRLGHLELAVREIAGERRPALHPLDMPVNNEGLLAWLRMQGLVRDPTDEEKSLAAEWDELSDGERQSILWELSHLPPGEMASEIIIENRR